MFLVDTNQYAHYVLQTDGVASLVWIWFVLQYLKNYFTIQKLI